MYPDVQSMLQLTGCELAGEACNLVALPGRKKGRRQQCAAEHVLVPSCMARAAIHLDASHRRTENKVRKDGASRYAVHKTSKVPLHSLGRSARVPLLSGSAQTSQLRRFALGSPTSFTPVSPLRPNPCVHRQAVRPGICLLACRHALPCPPVACRRKFLRSTSSSKPKP